MNRVLRIDEEKPEMHISVQGYKVTLCFAEKENPEVAVLVKQALLSAYAMLQKQNDLLKVLHSEDLMKGWSVKWLKESIAYAERVYCLYRGTFAFGRLMRPKNFEQSTG